MPVARSRQSTPDQTSGQELITGRELGPSTVLLAVVGDVDAAAAPTLFDRVIHLISGYKQLVLDLSQVSFFSTAGYSLLHRLDVFCTRASVDWALVVGPEVARLLRVCDPERTFPAAANIVSAAATLARGPHRTPQLSALR